MNASNPIIRLESDLTAHWTEPVLEILKAAGMDHVSIERELEAWHALNAALRVEVRWQRAFRMTTKVSLSAVMEKVFLRAISLLSRKHLIWPASLETESRVRQWIRDRRPTLSEHRLFAELVREPALRGAFKSPSQSDFVPRLRTTAMV